MEDLASQGASTENSQVSDEDGKAKKKMWEALGGALGGMSQRGSGSQQMGGSMPQPAQMSPYQPSFQSPQNIMGDARYEALSRLSR